MYNSTHDTPEEFFNSLTPLQNAALHLLNPESPHAETIQALLASSWDQNPSIRYIIGQTSNDYWRQFTYSLDFDDLHDGQRLHVLGTLLTVTTKYINEHNNFLTQQNKQNEEQPNL